jgi:hypothetical protein
MVKAPQDKMLKFMMWVNKSWEKQNKMHPLTWLTLKVWIPTTAMMCSIYLFHRLYWRHEEAAGRGTPRIDTRILAFDRRPPVSVTRRPDFIPKKE